LIIEGATETVSQLIMPFKSINNKNYYWILNQKCIFSTMRKDFTITLCFKYFVYFLEMSFITLFYDWTLACLVTLVPNIVNPAADVKPNNKNCCSIVRKDSYFLNWVLQMLLLWNLFLQDWLCTSLTKFWTCTVCESKDGTYLSGPHLLAS